jgi:DNA polymerase V
MNPPATTHSSAAAPAIAESDAGAPDCSGGESFALQVLGMSMEPEFEEGDIVIIEPDGLVGHGSFVLAQSRQGWLLRQLLKDDSRWVLHALNPAFEDEPLSGLEAVRGVVIQKAKPGRRRASKRYI